MATSPLTIHLPKDYGYVLLTAAGSVALSYWHLVRTGSFRRAAGVPYPVPYALANLSPDNSYVDKATPKAKAEYLFNCAQRAHGQFLEHYSMFVPMLLVSGLEWPRASAALGAVWGVSRVLYAVGYTRPDKEKGSGRMVGSGYAFVELAYMFMCGKMGWDLLMK